MLFHTLFSANDPQVRLIKLLLMLLVPSILFSVAPERYCAAAVQMQTGDRQTRLDESGLSISGDDRDAGTGRNMSTPPRPEPESAAPQELPYGIVPEVYVPWRVQGQRERPDSNRHQNNQRQSGKKPGQGDSNWQQYNRPGQGGSPDANRPQNNQRQSGKRPGQGDSNWQQHNRPGQGDSPDANRQQNNGPGREKRPDSNRRQGDTPGQGRN